MLWIRQIRQIRQMSDPILNLFSWKWTSFKLVKSYNESVINPENWFCLITKKKRIKWNQYTVIIHNTVQPSFRGAILLYIFALIFKYHMLLILFKRCWIEYKFCLCTGKWLCRVPFFGVRLRFHFLWNFFIPQKKQFDDSVSL